MRLLLVDNHRPHINTLKRGLKKCGFAVDVASDLATGDYKARTDDYPVIVLNRTLPPGDALSLVPSWRRAGINSNVLVLTPRRDITDAVRCLDVGADDYLMVPFEPEELFARLRALMRRNRRPNGNLVRIDDLEVDLHARRVKRRGEYLHLTRREYGLFEFLVKHRGQIVSRSTIWSHLYDAVDANTSNVVDVYIRYLRKKIDNDRDRPLIVTYYGRGYMLRSDGTEGA
jgi:DNA-binding response OmpR family regulator